MAECIVDKRNLGVSRCNKLPGMLLAMITTGINFKCTPAQAIDPEFWQDALLDDVANRIYKWPDFDMVEYKGTETTYEETPLSLLPVRDGQYRYLVSISKNMCLHKAMYSHRANTGRVILIDTEGQMIMTERSDGDLQGQLIQLIHTENLKISDGQVATKSPIMVALKDPKELNKFGVLVDAPFISSLIPLTDVTLTIVGDPGEDSLVVDVKVSCDGTPVNGLLYTDFVLLKADGDAQTTPPTAVAEVDGRYTLSKVAGTAWVTGTLDLKPAADLSVEGFESEEEVTVTVV